MSKGEHLYKLVSSFDNNELEYVKGRLNDVPNKRRAELLQLFYICLKIAGKAENYSGRKMLELLRKENADESFLNNIAFWKKTLYDKLLLFLRDFYRDKNRLSERIEQFKANASILWRKGMQIQAISELKKALKLAEKSDWFNYISIILSLRSLMHEYDVNKTGIEKLLPASQFIFDQIRIELKLFDLYEQSYLGIRNKTKNSRKIFESIPERLNDLLNKQVINNQNSTAQTLKIVNDISESLSVRAYFQLFFLIAIYFRTVERDFESSSVFLESLLFLIDKDKAEDQVDQANYLNLLNNILNNQFLAGRIKEMPIIIEKLSLVKSHNPGIEAKKRHHLHYYQMMSALAIKDYQAVTVLEKTIEASWEGYEKLLSHSRKLTFYYNLSVAFMIENRLNEAIKWNNKNLDDRNFRIRPDIRKLARIVELILFFDEDVLKNRFIDSFRIAHYGKSLIRSLKYSKQERKIEIEIVKTIMEAARQTDFRKVEASFNKLRSVLSGSVKNQAAEFSGFLDWINRRFPD